MQLLVAIFSAVASLILALFVLLKNKKSSTNVYFGILVIFLGLYPIFNYLALNASTSEEVFMWAKMILLVSIPAGPFFYFFVKVFPGSEFIFRKKLQIFMLFWALVNILLAQSDLVFSSVFIKDGSLQIVPGPAITSFVSLQIIGIISGSIVLVKKYIGSSGKLKLQLQYITFGILTSFGLNLLATVIMPIAFQTTILLAISPLFLLFGEVVVSFTIVRHRLFDIRPALARAVSFTLLTIVMAAVYTAILFLFSRSLFEDVVGSVTIFALTGLNILMVFTFQPLTQLFGRITDKIFYKDKYNAPELLHELSTIMASTLMLEDITRKLIDALVREMRITEAAFILLEQGKIYQVSAHGYGKMPEIYESEIVQLMFTREVQVYGAIEDEKIKTIYDKYGFNLVVKLATDESEIGLLVLGQKLSGEAYTHLDGQLISILAPQMAVAIENAKSYEEIKRFNITLKNEVDQATKSLKKANLKLQELDRLKDDFVSIASHELRTPMTAIKSYLWMALAGKGGKLSEKQRYYLERSFSATERLIKLVNDMLNISRIEAGRIVLDVSRFSMLNLTKEVIEEVKSRADELKLKITMDVKNSEGRSDQFSVAGDEDKVREVMINLIGNSFKFTPAKGVITVTLLREGDLVITKIADTGSGISPSNIKNLFQKFAMMKDSYQTNQEAAKGAGLGLFICRSIIDMHKGEIWAESKGLGHGATFSFALLRSTPKNLSDLKRKNKDKAEVEIIPSKL